MEINESHGLSYFQVEVCGNFVSHSFPFTIYVELLGSQVFGNLL